MKTNKIKDERIVQLNNKIQSEAFILIIAILALSIFIKAYMLDMGVREYLTEMIVMIVSIVYLSIRGAMVGYSSMDNLYFGKKFKVISALLLAELEIILCMGKNILEYWTYIFLL